MLFDDRPKESRDDLFDRDDELRRLHSVVSEPLVVITGIRRIGKTSVLKVFLNEAGIPYALIDARSPLTSYRALYSMFSDALTQLIRRGVGRDALRHITGVSIMGFSISLSWEPRRRAPLMRILDEVNDSGRVIIAIDEAQNLRGKLSSELLSLMAHCYDYCRNVTFIVTGSEAGLLNDFLRIEDPESPLYGRHVEEVRIERFSRELSLEFLREGFRQVGINPPVEVLEYAVDRLDGVVGWLTEFGHRCAMIGEAKASIVDDVLEVAAQVTIRELSHFSREYVTVLEAIARGYERWSEIKDYLEERRKRTIYDAELRRYLTALEKRSYISRVDKGRYAIVDPVVKNALTKLRRNH